MTGAPLLAGLVPALSAAAAVVLVLLPAWRLAATLNVAASAGVFGCALALAAAPRGAGPLLIADDLNVLFVALNSFVALTTSLFSARYVAHELTTGRLTAANLRFYHAGFQVLLGAMNLALVSNNLGVMWVAIEVATLSSVVMVGLYRTEAAMEAAWKYFMLGSVGIALALFGTILVYMAAQPVVGEGPDGMIWSVLMTHAGDLDPALLNVAFVFLLLGYGTKVGLVPLQAWLPDAHAEGPTPVSAILSGLLLNVALLAVLRFKLLLAAHPGAIAPGPLMMAMGLASLLLAGVVLYRRRDIKRLFAYSSIEHMGLIAFAFGLGGPLASFAGLLHVAMHSLGKSAVFFAVGSACQAKGTQRLADIRGLTTSDPALGWGLVAAVLAVAGLPPGGMFLSEFLLVGATFGRMPLLAVPLVAGLLLAFGGLLLKLSGIAFGAPPDPVPGATPARGSALALWLPLGLHLALVLVAGLYLPPPLVDWLRQVAAFLG